MSPFDGKTLELPDTPQDYSFYFAGHVYGSANNDSVFPAASFLVALDMINESGAKFLVLNGDIVVAPTAIFMDNFKRSVTDRVRVPVFNAPGNHELSEGTDIYEDVFGKTYCEFKYGAELYVILDTTSGLGMPAGEQREWFRDVLRQAADTPEIKNVFIFTHYVIWSKNTEAMSRILFPNVNGPEFYEKIDDFRSVVMPDIIQLSKAKNIFMVAGDIGAGESLPLFYHRDPDNNITYIASGIGNTPGDTIMKVEIKKDSTVTFTPISLTGRELENIEYYGLDYWEAEKGSADPDNVLTGFWFRALKIAGHLYFQIGVVLTLIAVAVIIIAFIVFRKLLRKK